MLELKSTFKVFGRTVLTLLFVLILVVVVHPPAQAIEETKNPEKRKIAAEYVELQMSFYVKSMVASGLEQIESNLVSCQAQKSKCNPKPYLEAREQYQKASGALTAQIYQLLIDHFMAILTKADLIELIGFSKSQAGSKVLADQKTWMVTPNGQKVLMLPRNKVKEIYARLIKSKTDTVTAAPADTK